MSLQWSLLFPSFSSILLVTPHSIEHQQETEQTLHSSCFYFQRQGADPRGRAGGGGAGLGHVRTPQAQLVILVPVFRHPPLGHHPAIHCCRGAGELRGVGILLPVPHEHHQPLGGNPVPQTQTGRTPQHEALGVQG